MDFHLSIQFKTLNSCWHVEPKVTTQSVRTVISIVLHLNQSPPHFTTCIIFWTSTTTPILTTGTKWQTQTWMQSTSQNMLLLHKHTLDSHWKNTKDRQINIQWAANTLWISLESTFPEVQFSAAYLTSKIQMLTCWWDPVLCTTCSLGLAGGWESSNMMSVPVKDTLSSSRFNSSCMTAFACSNRPRISSIIPPAEMKARHNWERERERAVHFVAAMKQKTTSQKLWRTS